MDKDKKHIKIESVSKLRNGDASVRLSITDKALEFIIDDFMARSVEGVVEKADPDNYWIGESNDEGDS